ncbi:MAG: MBG domain-containing protein [Alphaproteobacteria bacterium]
MLIGGDYQGGKDARTKTLAETVANAATTSVAAGARLSADGSAGDGSMTYGDTPPTGITYTATGWKCGQSNSLLTGVTTGTAATATSNVGSYATSASGGTLGGATLPATTPSVTSMAR